MRTPTPITRPAFLTCSIEALALWACLFAAGPALHAQEADCLFDISTGFDQEFGEPVPEGEADDDYVVDSGFGFEDALIVSSAGFPIPPWIDNTEECRWISSTFDTNAPPADYTYEIAFDLPDDIDPARVTIVGTWAIDNSITEVFVNDSPAGINGVGGFTAPLEFPSDATLGLFTPGFNVIHFIVNNAPPNDNPVGLRINACLVEVASEKRSLDLGTGFDAEAPALLEPGSPDPDYILRGPPGSGIGPEPATVSADGCGAGDWVSRRINARWIGPNDGLCSAPVGEYTYSTAINLPPDFEIDRAVIKGAGVAVDNDIADLLVNGRPTGFFAAGSTQLVPFPVDLGRGLFEAGANTVEFVVNNRDVGAGGLSTGLLVDAQVALGAPAVELAPSLFSLDTGFDNETGAVIANNEGDDSYVVVGPPGSDIGPVPATVVNDGAFPIGPWIASTAQSKWIGVAATSSNGPPGIYGFRITVLLPDGIDASQARIIGAASADNGATEILINGVSTGVGVTGAFNTLPPLPEDLGLGMFENGENIVEFRVQNAGTADNPVGLRVEAVVGTGRIDPADISTGIGLRGVGPLPGGADDTRYTLRGPAGAGIGPRPAVTVPEDGFPIPPWLENDGDSQWIGLDANDSVGPAGEYRYEIAFEVGAEQNPAKVSLTGGWAAAARGADVELNGTSLGLESAGAADLTPFPGGAGRGLFVSGTNVLAFTVASTAEGPTGLRVSARVASTPEPNPFDISTGFDQDEGLALPEPDLEEVFDDDYTFIDPDGFSDTSVVVRQDAFPIPPWAANTETSRWIGVPPAQDSNGPPGEYRFETFVVLSAEEAEEAVLVGAWSAACSGVDLLINDESTGITSGAFPALTPLPEAAGAGLFEAGFNSIVFVVVNGGDAANPVGLRVDAVVDVPDTGPPRTRFRRGDPLDTGTVNIASAVAILSFLFVAEVDTLLCLEAGDINNDGSINIADPVGLLNHLFGAAAEPAPPGIENCGEDPDAPGSPGDLPCDTYTSC